MRRPPPLSSRLGLDRIRRQFSSRNSLHGFVEESVGLFCCFDYLSPCCLPSDCSKAPYLSQLPSPSDLSAYVQVEGGVKPEWIGERQPPPPPPCRLSKFQPAGPPPLPWLMRATHGESRQETSIASTDWIGLLVPFSPKISSVSREHIDDIRVELPHYVPNPHT